MNLYCVGLKVIDWYELLVYWALFNVSSVFIISSVFIFIIFWCFGVPKLGSSNFFSAYWQGNYTGIAHIMLQLQQLLHSQARAITAINALASSCIYL